MTAHSPISVAPSTEPAVRRVIAADLAWPLSGIAFVLALQASLVFTRAINWDEFFHYYEILQFERGTLTQPLQTIFVRIFAWLTRLPGTTVDHIIVARLFMFGCEVVAAAAVAAIAARFTSWKTGLVCVLCYLSAGYVLQHGSSFRADPVDAALLMGALWVLSCTKFRGFEVALFGALAACAALYTIKCVLYAPAFAGLAWLRWTESDDRRAFARRLIAGILAAALVFGGLLFLHSQAVPDATGSAGTLLNSSASKMLSLGSPLYRRYIVTAAITAPLLALLIVLLPRALMKSSISANRKIAIAGLWLPILALGMYHNTAPYFYVFVLAPVAVACAIPLSSLLSRVDVKLVTTALAAFAFMLWAGENRTIIDRQRTIVRAASTIFPAPVSYFDFPAMLADHDKANVFMTPWGIDLYQNGGSPSMVEIMRQKTVPLVVENDPMFTQLFRSRGPAPQFLPEDAVALRDTYLHFWGPFWVAGETVSANTAHALTAIRVPGPYTVSGSTVAINGRPFGPGAVVRLQRGAYRLSNVGDRTARLTWGDHLRLPDDPAPPEPMWVWF